MHIASPTLTYINMWSTHKRDPEESQKICSTRFQTITLKFSCVLEKKENFCESIFIMSEPKRELETKAQRNVPMGADYTEPLLYLKKKCFCL